MWPLLLILVENFPNSKKKKNKNKQSIKKRAGTQALQLMKGLFPKRTVKTIEDLSTFGKHLFYTTTQSFTQNMIIIYYIISKGQLRIYLL